jgi:hypothetical protein
MTNVKASFEETMFTVDEARSGKVLIGYQEIKCHMIFDIKMEGLTRKARFVAGGHTTETPVSLTYSSVVSRDSVRIAFLIAALNDLEVWAADVGNAYLNAKCRERIWTIAGPEFGSNQGKVMKVLRALYGLKSSGAAWRNLFATSIVEMGYKTSLADPDVWIKANVNPKSNINYYEMVLVYVDDILCISHEPQVFMEEVARMYRLKEGSVGPPTRYLGANVGRYTLPDGRDVWSLSAHDYLKTVVQNLETTLAQKNEKLKGKASTPLPVDYKPELDITDLLEPMEANMYQQLIGILRWACEIGRIDILLEVSLMSSYNAYPRRGHLQAVYHIFAYIKQHLNSTIVFDDAYPDINEKAFPPHCDWSDFYPDATEPLPPRMPEPRGYSVEITCFVDANHAGNLLTRRSQTGFFIFINKAPIIWVSKRQNTVESSTFGSEFNALRVSIEHIAALRYKLRMFGVPIAGPANILCDNQSVVNNSSLPQSTLNKKHNAICYHLAREAVASGGVRIGKEDGVHNIADLLTKLLPGPRRKELLQKLTY